MYSNVTILLFSDHQRDPDFCIVARVEAFIAGWGLEEALKRAEAYREAGADAILMHSKRSDANEIEAFVKAWDNKVIGIFVTHLIETWEGKMGQADRYARDREPTAHRPRSRANSITPSPITGKFTL